MTILVTGGRGRVARGVVEGLLAAGEEVHVGSRDPASVPGTAGVEVVECDLARPETLAPALAGVTKVFLHADPRGVEGFAAAARAGVRHVVLLSARGASERSASPIARMHGNAEQALATSRIPWTFLRAGGFATNTLQWAESVRREGVVRAAYPNSHAALIHEADIAAVAVRALTEAGHDGRTYELTGPESITQRRQVELVAEATGRPVRFVDMAPEDYRRTLSRWGDEDGVDALLQGLAAADGRPDTVTDTVREVTGRPARTFAQWVADHAADFRP